MDTAYYGAVTVTLKPVCCHCGAPSGSNLLNNEYTLNLEQKYRKVQLICQICRAAGKKPSTWGTNNLNKKKKREKIVTYKLLETYMLFV